MVLTAILQQTRKVSLLYFSTHIQQNAAARLVNTNNLTPPFFVHH